MTGPDPRNAPPTRQARLDDRLPDYIGLLKWWLRNLPRLVARWVRRGFRGPFLKDLDLPVAPPEASTFDVGLSERRLRTTPARTQGGPSSDLCCAFAMAAAMETRLLTKTGSTFTIDETDIWNNSKQRSPHAAARGARLGASDQLGLTHRAKATLLSRPASLKADAMRAAIDQQIPLTAKIKLWSNFESAPDDRVYAPSGIQDGFHAVCIIGYGSGIQGEYWIARNSYGPTWNGDGCVMLPVDSPKISAEETVYLVEDVS